MINQNKNCKISNKCGGCQYLDLDYKETIKKKKEIATNCFKKEKIDFNFDRFIEAEKVYEYRNKMIVTYQMQNKNIVYGFFALNSHKVIPLDNCLMHSKIQNDIARSIKDLMNKFHILPYNEDKRIGIIRHVIIRTSNKKEQIMVVLVTSIENFPMKNEFVKALKSNFPQIVTIIQNINSRKTSIVLGDKERVLYGKGFIEDYLCGLSFQISSKSFYQINPYQTERLYSLVKEYLDLKGVERIVDAYSGIGTIGMSISKYAKYVYSVENNKQAVSYAIKNAKYNNIRNIDFVCQDATEYLLEKSRNKEYYDAIIMDPPRTGSTLEFLNSICMIKPKKIVYVSCNVITLVRDLKYLLPQYNIVKCSFVDMFCWTDHIETVMLLNKKG